MPAQIAFLPAYEFESGPVPLLIERHEGRTFIECDNGGIVLYYLNAKQNRDDDFGSYHIRGVCIPGEGAFFELFDKFGRVLSEPLTYSVECVEERLLNGIIWQVQSEPS